MRAAACKGEARGGKMFLEQFFDIYDRRRGRKTRRCTDESGRDAWLVKTKCVAVPLRELVKGRKRVSIIISRCGQIVMHLVIGHIHEQTTDGFCGGLCQLQTLYIVDNGSGRSGIVQCRFPHTRSVKLELDAYGFRGCGNLIPRIIIIIQIQLIPELSGLCGAQIMSRSDRDWIMVACRLL